MKRLVVLITLAVLLAACNPYRAAWTTMDGVLKARDTTATALAQKAKQAHEKCVKLGVKTQAYATCIKDWRAALEGWTLYGRPGITSTVRVTAVSVEIAEKKGNKKLDWKKVLRQLGCALSGVGSDWQHHVPEELKLIKLAIAGLGAATCPKAGVSDILGPIGTLIGWLAKALGEPLEVLKKRVKEVLAEPLSDGTDSVLATIKASMPAPAPASTR
jgi:hypothetical protein